MLSINICIYHTVWPSTSKYFKTTKKQKKKTDILTGVNPFHSPNTLSCRTTWFNNDTTERWLYVCLGASLPPSTAFCTTRRLDVSVVDWETGNCSLVLIKSSGWKRRQEIAPLVDPAINDSIGFGFYRKQKRDLL